MDDHNTLVFLSLAGLSSLMFVGTAGAYPKVERLTLSDHAR